MTDYYNKYYLSPDAISAMLSESQTPIVFDTSALLALYFYSENTRNEIFLKIFNYCHDRLWIPAQAFFEYQKNREKVSKKPIDAHRSLVDPKSKDGGYIKKILAECEEIKNRSIPSIEGQINTAIEQTKTNDKHPYIESSVYDSLITSINSFKEETDSFFESIRSFSERYDQLIESSIQSINSADDHVYETIVSKFSIGSEFSFDEMMTIAREGAIRYSEQIPPGYEDDEKIGLQKYGDLFFWKQLLKYACSKPKHDIILVTNDTKEDWFEKDKKTPRFELLKEFNSITGKKIWMLSLKEFIFLINQTVDTQLDSEAITEVENMEHTTNPKAYDLDEFESQIQNVLAPLDVWLVAPISIKGDLRLFENPVLYQAESSDQEEYRITITMLHDKGYAKTLHALANPFVIREDCMENDEMYRFINVVVFSSLSFTDTVLFYLIGKKNIKKYFNNKSIHVSKSFIKNFKPFSVNTYTSLK